MGQACDSAILNPASLDIASAESYWNRKIDVGFETKPALLKGLLSHVLAPNGDAALTHSA